MPIPLAKYYVQGWPLAVRVSPYSKIQEGGVLQIVIFAYTKRDALGVL